jgi:hypothetical protein
MISFMKNRLWILIFIISLFAAAAFAVEVGRLVVFYSPTCRECIEAKEKLIPALQKELGARLQVEYRDTGDIENYKLLLGLRDKYDSGLEIEVPVFFLSGKFLVQRPLSYRSLRNFVLAGLANRQKEPAFAQKADLLEHFKSITLAAIASAGLVDGINPCAFTVIVFFISFLALQGYRKMELAVIGLTFIAAVFLTYLLLGVGLFNFLYRLGAFVTAVKIFNLSIGVLSLVLGFFCIRDFIQFRRSGKTDGLAMQLPAAVKSQIHRLIGTRYRGSAGRHILSLAIGTLITGFLVSVLEAVCTGQMYLPTIAFVLKSTHLKLQALAYLLLYNLMFITPLFGVFILALLGVTSEQFAAFFRRHLLAVKILMAAIFFALGIILLSGCAAASEGGIVEDVKQQEALERVWDFGQAQEGEVLKHTFVLKNRSDKTLNIGEVHTSCGCTVSKVGKNSLAPQEETSIEVAFKTKGYSGAVQQFIYVNTDDPQNSVIRFIIKAEVVKVNAG